MISSFMTLGALIGALVTGFVGAHLSRRHALIISSVLLIVALAIMVEVTSFGGLYAARILCGLANGALLNFSMVFLQEITPPALRGLCFGLATFWITFGSLLGMVSLPTWKSAFVSRALLTRLP
jgi:MFS family permease